MWFSIRNKFLAVICVLLGACVTIYLAIAVQVFKQDKLELIYDLNRSQVANLTQEIDGQLQSAAEKMRLFSMLADRGDNRLISEVFGDDSDIVYAAIFKRNGEEVLFQKSHKKYLETYGITDKYFTQELHEKRAIPFEKIFRSGESIWNASLKDGPPLIGFGRRVLIENQDGAVNDFRAVISFVRLDRILKALQSTKLTEMSITNAEGEILNNHQVENFDKSQLFKKAKDSKVRTSVFAFEENDKKILGAFSKAYKEQVYIFSQANENIAFAAVKNLIERSLIFSLIVFTAAFLAAVLLSRSLTRPLAVLVERMNLAGQGDLSSEISVKASDETGYLAESFRKMMFELKQSRDELQEINRDLDQKVKERTDQLEKQNRVIKETQEALIRTTRLASAGEIAGKAAHEVLNPLTSLMTRLSIMDRKIKQNSESQLKLMDEIINAWDQDYQSGGFDSLVSSWKKPSEIESGTNLWQEDLGNMKSIHQGVGTTFGALLVDTDFVLKESGRISKIINGMRKLSHTKSDQKQISAHEVLSDACTIMGDLYSQKGFEIKQDFNAETDSIFIDKDEMLQAVTNLLRNSLQSIAAHKNASGYVRIVTASVDKQLQIYIEDNGVGIDEGHRKMLFEKQFTTKNSEEGTGLGLSISRRLMRSNGGDIEFISSSPGAKTVFLIRIPIVDSQSKGAAA